MKSTNFLVRILYYNAKSRELWEGKEMLDSIVHKNDERKFLLLFGHFETCQESKIGTLTVYEEIWEQEKRTLEKQTRYCK